MTPQIPPRQLIGLAIERFEVLAQPTNREPSPVRDGATPDEWATHAGIGAAAHPSVAELFDGILDVAPYAPGTIAHRALQRLTLRSLTERIGGLPMRYRPVKERS